MHNPLPPPKWSNTFTNSLTVRLILLLLALCSLMLAVGAEEKYVWDAAVVMTSTPFPFTGSDPQDLISGKFKSLVMTESGPDGDVWIAIDGQ